MDKFERAELLFSERLNRKGFGTKENGEEYVAIINRFVALAFINHDFDVKRIDEAPASDQKELRVIFYNAVGKRCEEDPQKLLAGVVERSLVYAFDEMKGKTK